MEIPDDINKWDIGTITNILYSGNYESDILEFKEDVSSNNERIARTCCAFANTKGGVLVFGVSDDRSKSTFERIIGLDKSQDNITLITNQLINIHPQIPSENLIFANSPIILENSRELIMIKILPSKYLHQFDSKFYKRFQGKNDFMPYDQIKEKFIENRKNKTALYLLLHELADTRHNLNTVMSFKDDVTVLSTIDHCNQVDTEILSNFMFNQSYLYNIKIQKGLVELAEVIRKLKGIEDAYKTFCELKGEYRTKNLEDMKVKTPEGFVIKTAHYFCEIGLEHIKTIEKEIGEKIPDINTKKYDDVFK